MYINLNVLLMPFYVRPLIIHPAILTYCPLMAAAQYQRELQKLNKSLQSEKEFEFKLHFDQIL